MSKQGKVWGHTRLIFSNCNNEIQYMECKAGKCCSKHCHKHKYNMFYVLEGELLIRIWKNDYDLIDETVLLAHESIIIKPNEYHRFEVVKDAKVLEVYWVELKLNDIIRESCGGDIISSNSSNLQYDSNGLLINNDNLSYQN